MESSEIIALRGISGHIVVRNRGPGHAPVIRDRCVVLEPVQARSKKGKTHSNPVRLIPVGI